MELLETERLVLRHFMEKDVLDLFAYLSKPRANCFISEKVDSVEESKKDVDERCQKESSIAICLKGTDKVIGDLFFEKEEPDTYCVGWNFNIEYQGKGYAYESAQALLAYLFGKTGARRVYAYVEDDNDRSRKLCERLGMRKEGCFMEFISFVNNPDGTPKYENTMQYAMLKREWDELLEG